MFNFILNALVLTFLYTVCLVFWLFYKFRECLQFLFKNKKVKILTKKLEKVQNYSEWKKMALELDETTGHLHWRKINSASYYDYKNIEQIITHLKKMKEEKKIYECVHFLRSILSRSFSGITNENLYNYALSGPKNLICEYYNTILESLEFVFNSEIENKLEFFRELKHFFGKSGLILSGGASVGMFHLGILSVLLEFDILPKIIAGASAGSLTSAFIGTNTKEELLFHSKNDFETLNFTAFDNLPNRGSFLRKLMRCIKHGYFIDKRPLKKFLIQNTHNLTFREAFNKTGIILNISITDSCHDKYRILNYITSPNVYIWSAALASCSLPMVYAPTSILAKTNKTQQIEWLPTKKLFIDGSIGADVPKKSLGVLFNVTNFIVSQVNVHIVPFLNSKHRSHKHSKRYFLYKLWLLISGFIISEFKHRINQMKKLNLIPNKLVLLSNMLLQDYTGNVNITPRLKIKDYLGLLDNPSTELVREWVPRGRNATFYHLKQIRDFKQIEQKLREYIKKLEKERIEKNYQKVGKSSVFTNSDF